MDAQLSKVFRRLHPPYATPPRNDGLSRPCTILLRTPDVAGPQENASRHHGSHVRRRHPQSSHRRNHSLFARRFVERFRPFHSSRKFASRGAL